MSEFGGTHRTKAELVEREVYTKGNRQVACYWNPLGQLLHAEKYVDQKQVDATTDADVVKEWLHEAPL